MARLEKIIEIEVYTDGSCKRIGELTFGGLAYVIVIDSKMVGCGSESYDTTTNQQMELLAAIKGLEAVDKIKKKEDKVVVYSDSAYLTNCYLQNWYLGWINKGWINSKGEPVANKELWMKLIPYFERYGYSFSKVKGHANSFYNNMCDEMAQRAAEELKQSWRGKNE